MREVVLIAGASKGVGQKIVDKLSRNYHYKVYGTSREEQKNGWNKLFLVLDVTDETAVQACMDQLRRREHTVHVLINTIEISCMGSGENIKLSELHGCMAVNYYGAVRLIKHVLPYMKQQKGGRIVHVSRTTNSFALPFNSSYAASKAASVAYLKALHYEVKRFGIHVSLIEPNASFSSMYNQSIPTIGQETSDYEQIEDEFRKKMTGINKTNATDEQLAEKTMLLLKEQAPAFYYQVGQSNAFNKFQQFISKRQLQQRMKAQFINQASYKSVDR